MSGTERDIYIARETRISVVVNATLSLVFFLFAFGLEHPIEIRGLGNWVFDFSPQSFMIALMSTLVPGAIARRRLRAGTLAVTEHRSMLPSGLLARSLLVGGLGAVAGVGLAGGFALLLEPAPIAPLTGLAVKVGYAGLLALLVTPPSLRVALASAPNQSFERT